MAKNKQRNKESSEPISRLSVRGFKSFKAKAEIEIAPLTIVAGANSCGKSTMFQSLLLLKQTLEASFDAGALLINGPNVAFSEVDQLFTKASRSAGDSTNQELEFGVAVGGLSHVKLRYRNDSEEGLGIASVDFTVGQSRIGAGVLKPGMRHRSLTSYFPEEFQKLPEVEKYKVARSRCFLDVVAVGKSGNPVFGFSPCGVLVHPILEMIHIPGLRGNPKRNYPVTGTRNRFEGVFPDYVATLLSHWAKEKNNRVEQVAEDLSHLGLTSKIETRRINDTQAEILVGRKNSGGRKNDLVSLADTGLGISQVLPIVVALWTASPGQLVLIEQPEIHLHPAAQVKLAGRIVNAVSRGVRCVIETHSSIFLLAIQREIARGKMDSSQVKLHWFSRDKQGFSVVDTASMDRTGAFGAWPQDFGDVSLDLEASYLDEVDNMNRTNG